jgi:hypothetical protein
MSDENWIRELAKAHRERQAEEEGQLGKHWDRLSSDELSAEEEAELLALAKASEEGRESYEAFRPLGPAFHASAVKAIQEQAIQEQAEKTIQEKKAARQKPPARLWPFPIPAQLAGWSAAAAAVAAAVLVRLFLFPPAPLPLPIYSSLEIHGDQAFRGEESSPAEVTVLAPGDHFQGQLQLETSSQAKDLEAQYFLIRGQDLRRLEAKSEIDPGGAVKISKGLVQRDLSLGPWTLWAVVGRRGKLPEPSELRRLSAKAPIHRRDWVAVPKEIRIQPREPPP